MTIFADPVSDYMTAPAHSVAPTTALSEVAELLDEYSHSSVAVVDSGEVVGVVSMTDLVRVGKQQAGSRPRDRLLVLPERPVSEVMTRGPVVVPPGASLREAASAMVEQKVHRVYVTADNELVGVLSTLDLMRVIAEAGLDVSLSELMRSPVFTIRSSESISMATERIEKAHVSGLVVLDDDGWAVGIYSQKEALAASSRSRDTTVEEVMCPRLLVIPARTPLHRAASQAEATRVRRLVAVNRGEVVGLLSGLDFARACL